jgi:hypothetical protein
VFALTGVAGHAHLAEGEHGHAAPLEVQPTAAAPRVVSELTGRDGASGLPVEHVETDASRPDDEHDH